MLFNKDGDFYCPICSHFFAGSEYLATVFQEPQALWLANMVTHHRHEHIQWWDNCWGRYGNSYRGHWFTDYEAEKLKVNNSAKRVIMRKASSFMNEHGVNVGHLLQLQGNDEATIALGKKKLLVPPEIQLEMESERHDWLLDQIQSNNEVAL